MNLEAALARLDPENEDHWTAQGIPRIDAVVDLLDGEVVTRAQITEAAPHLTRDNAGPPAAPAPPAARALEPAPVPAPAAHIPAPAQVEPSPAVAESPSDLSSIPDGGDVLDLPFLQVTGSYELTCAALESINARVLEKLREEKDIKEELAQLYAKNEILKRAEVQHVRRNPSLRRGAHHSVREYQKRQAEARAMRQANAQAFLAHRTNPKDVAAQMQGKAPIDAALQNRPRPTQTAPIPKTIAQ